MTVSKEESVRIRVAYKHYRPKYNIGEIVYLKTDIDQDARMITAIQINQAGISYNLSCCLDSTWHFEIEIDNEKQYS